MVGLRGLTLASVVLLSLTAQAGAESASRPQPLSGAVAYGIKVLLPNQAPIVAGLVDAGTDDRRSGLLHVPGGRIDP